MFRDQLSSQELVERLFATADKTGLFSDSTIYGQGLVDLDARDLTRRRIAGNIR